MSDKQLLLSFPEARTVNYIEDQLDEQGKQIIDEASKLPIKRINRSEIVSCLVGLDMAMLNAQALVQAGHDFFDVQELRSKIKKSFDTRGRHDFDDRYLILSEAQHVILIEAIKKFDWSMKRKLPEGGETEGVDFWLNWFEFFEGVKKPKDHNIEAPDSSYASWALEKASRLAHEAEQEKAALEKAANTVRSEGDVNV